MSSDSGKTKTQTVSSVSAPWGPQQGPIQQSLEDATKLYNSGGLNLNYYPGQTVAGVAPETAQSWQGISNLAQNGGGAVNEANNYAKSILSGDYTALNPAISRLTNQANANYSAAGRYGSGAHDGAIGDSVGNLIFSQMNNAAQMAPGLNQARYFDQQQLAGVGAQRQDYAQQLINADIDKFNWLQNAPGNAISRYQDLISGNYGATTSGTQPYQGNGSANPWLQGIGAAAQFGGSLLGSMQ